MLARVVGWQHDPATTGHTGPMVRATVTAPSAATFCTSRWSPFVTHPAR
jgi:hypothetical protein